MPETNSIHLGA